MNNNLKRVIKYTGVALLIFIVILIVKGQISGYYNSVHFTLTVPATTPPDEPIVMHYGIDTMVMQKTGPNTYEAELSVKDLERDFEIFYGYSRGGMMEFGEYGLWKIGKNGEMPRVLRDGDTDIKDTVMRWKWLPTEPLAEKDIPTSADSTKFAPRAQFMKGVVMPDFWSEAWELNYDSTIKKLRDLGADTIALKPPVALKSADPVTYVLGEPIGNCPAYPEEKLREHIRVFKQAGFKVFIEPQLCDNPARVGRSDAWWGQHYDEVEKVVLYHAKIAREEGADVFVLNGFNGPGELGAAHLAQEYWDGLVDAAKTSGLPVGFSSGAWEPGNGERYPHPIRIIPESVRQRFDFFAVGFTNGMVTTKHPTQSQVDAGIRAMFAQIDRLTKDTGKPVVIGPIGYESRVGTALGAIPEIPYVYQDPDAIEREHGVVLDTAAQAMIYEAIMKEIAARPYVTGVFSWGYHYVDAPLSPDPSIRGKMAERILKQWFEGI